jgi:hypothetical protein
MKCNDRKKRNLKMSVKDGVKERKKEKRKIGGKRYKGARR